MMNYLGLNQKQADDVHAIHTTREITQQPQTWLAVAEHLATLPALQDFLQARLSTPALRIILTGAGTSAYVGDVLADYLSDKLARRVEAIATTDLVSHPARYFADKSPTLLVSFARSGNSPESVAALTLAELCHSDLYHLSFSCNANGALHHAVAQRANGFAVLMPEATLDKSFAMTSSFTTMLVACLQAFSPDQQQLSAVANATARLICEEANALQALAEVPFSRVVFLGSGALKGFAQEAALKYLELSAGQIWSSFETPLGFRHGPKSMINKETLVVLLQSSDEYAARYDLDLQRELARDGKAHVIALSQAQFMTDLNALDDVWLGLIYIVYCQILACFKAISLGISPDNPCPSGEVNRVVQGVIIHPLQ
ncbi:SIS domain-containing protein [Pseudoalteromonas fenneropenaei]|uniref:SIS domain-containing protein n=1 Tax=Pseudoalteromonas fenneropenaei TaxID=1737459 RepID=A0ABV7CPR3_9GAMM